MPMSTKTIQVHDCTCRTGDDIGIWNIVILGVSVSVYWEENLRVRPHVPTNTHLIIELSIFFIFSFTCNISRLMLTNVFRAFVKETKYNIFVLN